MSKGLHVGEAVYSVSYWIEAERYWRFAGQGSRAWCKEREAYLISTGIERTRIRKLK